MRMAFMTSQATQRRLQRTRDYGINSLPGKIVVQLACKEGIVVSTVCQLGVVVKKACQLGIVVSTFFQVGLRYKQFPR